MAVPAHFPGANMVFTAPKDREDVCDLEVFTNGHANVSAWQLGPDELEAINRNGGIVYLSVLSGPVFYPVAVGSEESIRLMVADYGKVWAR